MKTALQISTHSFVDLITNSSSELFVCDSKKTIETIKEILQTLLDTHNKLLAVNYTFENVFGDIFVSKYQFDWWKVPENLRNRFELYNTYCMYSLNRYTGEFIQPNSNRLEEQELEKIQHEIGKSIGIHESGLYESNKKEYDRRWKRYHKQVDKLWTDYGARCLSVDFELFFEFLRQNEFSDEKIEKAKKVAQKAVQYHIKNKCGRWSRGNNFKFSKDMTDAFDRYKDLTSWGINCNKGDVFVYSKRDNSIPYELMESIEHYLSARRYHLG